MGSLDDKSQTQARPHTSNVHQFSLLAVCYETGSKYNPSYSKSLRTFAKFKPKQTGFTLA